VYTKFRFIMVMNLSFLGGFDTFVLGRLSRNVCLQMLKLSFESRLRTSHRWMIFIVVDQAAWDSLK
jgi:hypothetical protein